MSLQTRAELAQKIDGAGLASIFSTVSSSYKDGGVVVVERVGRRGEGEEGSAPLQGDILSSEDFDAVIFDLDGVITDTASVHFASWKEVFDNFLRASQGRGFNPFTEEDYRRYVDGKPRLDGVRSFLDSRGITLPEGEKRPAFEEDHTETETILSLGEKKNEKFQQRLESGQIKAFEESEDLVRQVLRKGIRTALVSSSKNARRVLEVLGIDNLFDVCVDGKTLDTLGLKGKPAADMFAEAANRLGVAPERVAVVEDAEAGVEAAKAGNFSLVVGVARKDDARESLLDNGADLVVDDLGQLITRH